MTAVPLAVTEEILLNLPAHQVVRACRLVCQEWKELVDSAAHWKERCRREGFRPCHASRPPHDWRLFYFLSRKRHNLLTNPSAQEELRGWTIVSDGGDHWVVQENRKAFPDNTVTKCFVTSYGLCLKQQVVDLEKEGYGPSFMDSFQPDIKISDWYAPRFDCGCEYQICVELLTSSKKVLSVFQFPNVRLPQWNDEAWSQVSHVFRDYGPGVRYVRFTHGGKDTQFWAGWYGVRLTCSSVEVWPASQS